MIFPVAETLKVFFALEWVLTFGIAFLLHITLLVAPHRRNAFGTVWVNWAAKVGLLGENTKHGKMALGVGGRLKVVGCRKVRPTYNLQPST